MPNPNLNKLNVFITLQGDDIPVGTLAHTGNEFYFEYHDNFIQRGLEISPYHLPLRNKLSRNTSRPELLNLPGVFYDSLPDGWGWLVMDRVFRQHAINPATVSPLTRLGYIGDRAVGALRYEPHSQLVDDEDFRPLDLLELANESERILKGTTQEVINEVVIAGGSPGGARPKALIAINARNDEAIYGVYDVPEDYDHYVVKFLGPVDAEDFGRVEYIYYLMARDAGIEVPESRLVDAEDRQFFASKRFDRHNNQKLHMHTLGGMLQSNFRVAEASYDDLLRVIKHLTQDQAQVIEGFRRMVFNVLGGNRDDHVKNFAFLMNREGQWRFSPMYDAVYSHGINGWHSMDVSGKQHPTKDELLALAKQHGVKAKAAIQIVEQVQHALSQWGQLARDYEITRDSKMLIDKTLKECKAS